MFVVQSLLEGGESPSRLEGRRPSVLFHSFCSQLLAQARFRQAQGEDPRAKSLNTMGPHGASGVTSLMVESVGSWSGKVKIKKLLKCESKV